MSQAVLRVVQREDSDKKKALEAALSQIDRAFGKGSVMKLGQRQSPVETEALSTGSLGLDIALGIGGLPRGRVIEIYGPESSGKTTLALSAVAEAQKKGGVAAYIDAEHALDPGYAKKLGVDIDELLISQPDTGEQALEITDTLVRSGGIDIIVINSVAALTPRAELEGEMGDQLPGLQARLMSQALRKLTGSISKSNTIVIFINQIRMKIGIMFGSPGDHHGRQRAQVLCLGAARYPPHRRHQGSRRRGRQPDPREGGEEQGRAAVPSGRIRHHVRLGHFQIRRTSRSRGQGRHHRKIRLVVFLRRLAHRPGPRNREDVPRIQQGCRERNRIRGAAERRPSVGPARHGGRRFRRRPRTIEQTFPPPEREGA